MKTLLASLLALLIAHQFASAQTLRWTHTITAPTAFAHDRNVAGVPITDAAGNLAVVVQFQDAFSNLTGFRILWLAASRGKVLMATDTATTNSSDVPVLLRISGTYLLAQFRGGTANQLLRRYRLVRGGVVQSDLASDGTTEFLVQENIDAYINRDTAGFYIFSQSSDGTNITAIKRYTLK